MEHAGLLLSAFALASLLLAGPVFAKTIRGSGTESDDPPSAHYSHYTGPHHAYDPDQWRRRYHHHPVYADPHHVYDRDQWRERYHHRAFSVWPAGPIARRP